MSSNTQRPARFTLDHRTRSAMPQNLLAVLLLFVLSGCVEDTHSPSPGVRPDAPESVIRSVNSAELRDLVATSDRPVLVEFSALSGCYRCSEMRSPIREKAEAMQQHADVVRIDFNLNQSLAQQLGATVCPSYVVFSQGQVVSVRTWPTSADLVAADVAAAVDHANGGQVAVPDRH